MGADPEHVLCNSKMRFLFVPLFILHFSSCNGPKTEEQSELPNLLPSHPAPLGQNQPGETRKWKQK